MKFEKLGDLIEIKKGKKPVFSENPNKTSQRVLQIDDLRNDNNLKFTDEISGVLAEKSDLLLAWDGANAGTIGYGKKGFIGSTIARLRAKEGINFSPPFLGSFLQSKFHYLRSKTTGATIPHIDTTILKSLKIPIFSLTDQIKIAQVLTQTERLIAQRKESITLLDDYLKGTFLEMFGDPVRNEKGWELRILKEFYINPKEGTKCGPFGSALKKNEYTSEGIPVWTMDNITKDGHFIEANCLWIDNEKFSELHSYTVQNNDVIISRAGTVGKMCVVNSKYKKSIISTNLIRVRFGKQLLPLHFVSLMNYSKERIAKLRTGGDGVFTHMNTGVLDSIIFPYPPIELQTQFAQIAEKAEALKSQYQRSLQELEQLFGSLSQRAFKGELGLSHMEVSEEEVQQIRDTFPSSTVPKSEKRKKEPLRLTQENEAALSIWQSQREKQKVGKIPFNPNEGNAVLSTEFAQKAQGFSFQQFETFLKAQGFDYAYEQVKDFLFEKLEQRELKQYYASQEWMEQRKRTGTDPDQTNFSDDGHIWLVSNNARG